MSYESKIIETLHFELPYANKKRRVRVLLPDSYQTHPEKSYPVIYMHDGQNVFFDEESYSGHSWRVIESLSDNTCLDAILVAIDHAMAYRLPEYSPFEIELPLDFKVPTYGGNGQLYGKWLVEVLKPYIDSHFPTKDDQSHTFLAGSSMGGLITAYIAGLYPDTFGGIGVLSLASWISEKAFLEFTTEHPLSKKTKVFIQVGTNEGDVKNKEPQVSKSQAYLNNSLAYYHSLLSYGHPIKNCQLKVIAGAIHEEKVWADSFPDFLKFML